MRYARMRLAALLLGVGLGASFEGIVFRQILDWHQMLSAVLPPDTPPAMRLSGLAEGWVQLAAWVVITAGVFVLSRTVRLAGRVPSTRSFFGYRGRHRLHRRRPRAARRPPARARRGARAALGGGSAPVVLARKALKEPKKNLQRKNGFPGSRGRLLQCSARSEPQPWILSLMPYWRSAYQ
jgi:hypothetical protein